MNNKFSELISNENSEVKFNILTNNNEKKTITTKYFINSGGLHADQIAK